MDCLFCCARSLLKKNADMRAIVDRVTSFMLFFRVGTTIDNPDFTVDAAATVSTEAANAADREKNKVVKTAVANAKKKRSIKLRLDCTETVGEEDKVVVICRCFTPKNLFTLFLIIFGPI
mmetsp:Transcript_20985/g.23263  ORF Transcript_20985/g.23263 Transcript_20985/m.23263 type:complete len:120 (+) Transcript_20985:725-1084(+)